MSAPIRRSPLARLHEGLGATFETEAGWDIVAGYGDEVAERALVREALELAAGSGSIQLRMHPDDLAVLGSQVELLTGELARLGTPEILADPTIEKGGCRVETRSGSIDQQFAAQIARIEQELA